jgi:hypothetical protein
VIFVLVATISGMNAELGNYNKIENCQSAAKDYANAWCKPKLADHPIYGTCWGCMHGCSWQTNIEICGRDPRPQDK